MFTKGEVKPDAASKGKLLSLLRAYPKDEPTRKKFINEMMVWSSKFGEYPAGDPEIHHVAGSLLAEGMCILTPYTQYGRIVSDGVLTESQIWSPTKQNATSSSAQKTPPKPSPNSNTPGTKPTTHTPRLSTSHAVSCLTS